MRYFQHFFNTHKRGLQLRLTKSSIDKSGFQVFWSWKEEHFLLEHKTSLCDGIKRLLLPLRFIHADTCFHYSKVSTLFLIHPVWPDGKVFGHSQQKNLPNRIFEGSISKPSKNFQRLFKNYAKSGEISPNLVPLIIHPKLSIHTIGTIEFLVLSLSKSSTMFNFDFIVDNIENIGAANFWVR